MDCSILNVITSFEVNSVYYRLSEFHIYKAYMIFNFLTLLTVWRIFVFLTKIFLYVALRQLCFLNVDIWS